MSRQGEGFEQEGNKDNGGRRPPLPREGRTDLDANDKMPASEASLDGVPPRRLGGAFGAEATIDAFRWVWRARGIFYNFAFSPLTGGGEV